MKRRGALDLGGVLFEEDDRVDVNVGVFAHGVGVRVVTRVLRVPPRVAQSDRCGEHAGKAVVLGASGEDLAVRGLVSEERGLGEDDADCSSNQQLEPAVAQQDESGDAASEENNEYGANHPVEPRSAAEESGITNGAGDLGVRVCDLGERIGAGVRLAKRAEICIDNAGCGDEKSSSLWERWTGPRVKKRSGSMGTLANESPHQTVNTT